MTYDHPPDQEHRRRMLAWPNPTTCAICGRHIDAGEFREPTTAYEPPGDACEPCSRKHIRQ